MKQERAPDKVQDITKKILSAVVPDGYEDMDPIEQLEAIGYSRDEITYKHVLVLEYADKAMSKGDIRAMDYLLKMGGEEVASVLDKKKAQTEAAKKTGLTLDNRRKKLELGIDKPDEESKYKGM